MNKSINKKWLILGALLLAVILPPVVFARPSAQLFGVIWGAGTTNQISKFTSQTIIGNSGITEDASGNVGIGTTAPGAKLDVLLPGNAFMRVGEAGSVVHVAGSGADLPLRVDASSASDVAYFRGQGGVPSLFLKGDGNVGIGTTNPTTKLYVADSVSTGNTVSITIDETSGGATELVMKAGVSGTGRRNAIRFIQKDISTTAPRWMIGGGLDQIAGDDKFQFQNAISSSVVTLLQNGNVGIGTTTPDHKLHIAVNAVDGFPFRMQNTAAGGGTWRFSMPATGSGGVAGSLILNTVGAGGNMMTWLDSGNVGIGTISPTERLDLAGGNIKMGYELVDVSFPNVSGATAYCSAGKRVLGGGCMASGLGPVITASVPNGSGTSWSCSYNMIVASIRVTAICANIR